MQDNFKGWVLEFLKKAGEISLEAQDKANAIFKDQKVDSIVQPETIVTETDLKLSALFEKYINENTDDKHVVIDEEKAPNSKEFLDKYKNTEYIWTIDPIDGTRTYYQGFPLWGTLISLFKNGEPILSACYLPAEKGLVFATENEGFFLKNAFTADEVKTPLGDFHHDLTEHSVIITPSWLKYSNGRHAHYDRDVYGMLDVYSSAEAIFSVHTGRAHG
ncbi:MAG: hypothetical protein N4A43_04960, partial [Alphaproteobacteria bacterium]|nr:hypothetical protein [Alphaproteobacteria bacterium]